MRPGISFDLDGVLIQNPFAKGVVPRIKAYIRHSPILQSMPQEEADQLIEHRVREQWGKFMTEGDFVSAYNWDKIYSSVSADFDWHPVPNVATIVEECCTDPNMIALLPGAFECLQALQKDYDLYAATNGYRAYQWPVLEALGIARFFTNIITPDRIGYAKPDLRFFEVIPNLEMHVGDTLLHDVLGANRAGITSIWVMPCLPTAFQLPNPFRRPSQQGFLDFIAQALLSTPYKNYHPEVDPASCLPDAVVVDVGELPHWLL